jgi:homospermidine synthase
MPSAFFIFADVSVRKAGEYRLQFTLMKMEPALMMQGSSVPAIHVVTSDMFRAVNAKDFDQVHPSTNLVRGLLDRGAGFPLKLKKGTREGQRGKRKASGTDSEDDDSGDLGTTHPGAAVSS